MATRCIKQAQSLLSLPSCSTSGVQKRTWTALPSLQLYSFRRRLAEKLSNRYNEERVNEIGPDLACLEWLMECGSTSVEMSDGQVLKRIKEMKEYIPHAISNKAKSEQTILISNLTYEKKWPHAPNVHITKVDASDSAIANEGFKYFQNLKNLETLKLNFCDYFGDDAIKYLAQGNPARTLKDLEIVLNPSMSDGAVYWLIKLKELRRAHFYFLPYVSSRKAFIRQLKLALPRCNVTFPEVDSIGYGYENKSK